MTANRKHRGTSPNERALERNDRLQLLALCRALSNRYLLPNARAMTICDTCPTKANVASRDAEDKTTSEAYEIGVCAGEMVVMKPSKVLRGLTFGIERALEGLGEIEDDEQTDNFRE